MWYCQFKVGNLLHKLTLFPKEWGEQVKVNNSKTCAAIFKKDFAEKHFLISKYYFIGLAVRTVVFSCVYQAITLPWWEREEAHFVSHVLSAKTKNIRKLHLREPNYVPITYIHTHVGGNRYQSLDCEKNTVSIKYFYLPIVLVKPRHKPWLCCQEWTYKKGGEKLRQQNTYLLQWRVAALLYNKMVCSGS